MTDIYNLRQGFDFNKERPVYVILMVGFVVFLLAVDD